MASDSERVILITGIMASGKSSVAQRLAERLPKSVHLRGDAFRRIIINGRVEMEPPPSEAALAQLLLRYRAAAIVADLYCAAGFTVVYQDVIIGPDLKYVVDLLTEKQPTHVVVLTPSVDVVEQREAAREKKGYDRWTPQQLHDGLMNDTPRLGLWLDTSHLTIDETVDAILARLDEAAVIPDTVDTE